MRSEHCLHLFEDKNPNLVAPGSGIATHLHENLIEVLYRSGSVGGTEVQHISCEKCPPGKQIRTPEQD